MLLGLLLFQNATPSPATSPEKSPAWLTFVYLLGLALIALLLITSLLRVWLSRPATAVTAPANLPKDIRNRLGATATNRGLRAWRWLFVAVSIAIFSVHVYWARYAPLRNRRLSESTLRGWIYDRKGRPLAYYKKDGGGDIVRQYPLDAAMAHIFGS